MGESGSRMSWVGRVAAVGAIIIALAAVGYLMLGGGDSYEVRARFQAATQMVKGNLVQVGGRKVGLVKEIKLTRNGEASERRPADEHVDVSVQRGAIDPSLRGSHRHGA